MISDKLLVSYFKQLFYFAVSLLEPKSTNQKENKLSQLRFFQKELLGYFNFMGVKIYLTIYIVQMLK